MSTSLRTLWESRSPRDRTIIVALAIIVGAVLYVWLVLSAERATASLRTSVTTLQAQATRVDQQALEYGHLIGEPRATASPTDLRTLVQARIGEAGLSPGLVRIDALDADRVVVVFGAVGFANWLAWIADLKSQHVRLDSCRIEAMSTPGLVGVTATLVRSKTP